MLEIICKQCERRHQAGEEHLGKYLRCAGCGSQVLIALRSRHLESDSALKTQGGAAFINKPPGATAALDKKPHSRFARRRGYLTFASFLVMLVASSIFVYLRAGRKAAHQAYNTPPSSVSSSGLPTLDPADVEELRPEAANYRRITPTGTRFMKDLATGGYGELKAINGTAFDACLIVMDGETQTRVRMLSIRAQDAYTLLQLHGGQYVVLFATGLDWDSSEEEFTQHASYTRFGKPLWFSETSTSYDKVTITLHTVPDGNVTPIPLSAAQFHAQSRRGTVEASNE
jgi:DNA-directed RNA polymerase subunit RPC12/RpoP